jgi:hypothetical protein
VRSSTQAVTDKGIPFTQFLMPNGRKEQVWIKRPAPIEEKAAAILAKGLRFECEMLSDYATIHLTISDPAEGEDVAVKLCSNGPAVPDAVDSLIAEFAL